jgi:uncharacterized protein YhfF
MLAPHLEAYWQAYLATLPAEAPQHTAFVEAWAFGDNPALADELAGLVLEGKKTATCSNLWSYEGEGTPLPAAGQYSIILGGDGQPRCIIETVEVSVRPFNQVDAQFAYEEGEDDRSLAAWRNAHWRYFTRTLAAHGLAPNEEMPLVCERFRVVHRG